MPRSKDHIKSIFNKNHKFEYKPLNPDRKETRVLVFEQKSHGQNRQSSSTLSCRLKVISLLNEPQPLYYAISYCWGKDPPLQRIVLNGDEAWVPESAVKALQTVCHPVYGKRDLPVWIDAICINQADDAEKSLQVAMMAEIYSKASQVLIWLGDEDSTTEAALKTINEVVLEQADGTVGDRRIFSDRSDLAALVKFFDTPYFGRLWPVQEICLSTSAVCWRGKFQIDWTAVLKTSMVVDKASDEYPEICGYDGCAGFLGVRAMGFIQSRGNSVHQYFEEVFMLCSMFETTDPRDEIYATLGLLDTRRLSRASLDLLRPDYTLALRDVYVRATVAAVYSRGALHHLAYAQRSDPVERYADPVERERDSCDVPSWVPRYDLRTLEAPVIPWRDRGSDGKTPAVYDFDTKILDVLKINGVIFSEVTCVRPAIPFLGSSVRDIHNGLEKLGVCFKYLWELDAGFGVTPDALKQIALTYVVFLGTKDQDKDEVVADFSAFLAMCKDHWEYARTLYSTHVF